MNKTSCKITYIIFYLYKVWEQAKQYYMLYIDKYVLSSSFKACKGMLITKFRIVVTFKESWRVMRSGRATKWSSTMYIIYCFFKIKICSKFGKMLRIDLVLYFLYVSQKWITRKLFMLRCSFIILNHLSW